MKKTNHILQKIRKSLHFGLFFCCIALLLAGCDHFPWEKFDKSLLSGYWVSGTVHEFYDPAGTGYTWDTADDVTEEEAQPFTWEFADETNTLTLIHQMEMGGVIPKSYTVVALSEDELEFKDRFGVHYTFKRV